MDNKRNRLYQGPSQLESGQGQSNLLTDREVSRMLGVSLGTVRRWRLFRGGPRFRKLGSAVRYALADIETWLSQQPTGGSSLAEVNHG